MAPPKTSATHHPFFPPETPHPPLSHSTSSSCPFCTDSSHLAPPPTSSPTTPSQCGNLLSPPHRFHQNTSPQQLYYTCITAPAAPSHPRTPTNTHEHPQRGYCNRPLERAGRCMLFIGIKYGKIENDLICNAERVVGEQNQELNIGRLKMTSFATRKEWLENRIRN